MKTLIRTSFISFILLLSAGKVHAQLNANFTATSNKVGCTPFHSVDFENTSTGTFHYVGWDFDADGTIDLEGFPGFNPSINVPTWPFQDAGVYSIRLLIRDTISGQEDEITINDYVTSRQSPSAEFEGDPLVGCGLQVVNFTDLSVSGDANIVSWSWEFGNGMTSNLQDPVITYSNVTGTLQSYNVSLILVDANGCTSNEFKADYIALEPGVIPDFELLPSDTCAPPLIVEINNLSIGIEPLTYSWDFGNGETSDLENPGPITYTEFGTFDVTLTLSNPLCDAELTKVVTIANDLEVSFEYASNCEGKVTQFFNTSNGAYDTFSWDFGDGTAISSEENPEHTYDIANVYNVKLTAFIGEGCENFHEEGVPVNEPDTIKYDKDTTYIVCEIGQNITIPILNDNIQEFSWELVDAEGGIVFSGDTSLVSMTFTEDQAEGTYFLSMYTLFETGCEDSTLAPIPITVSFPKIGGMVDPDMGCVPIDVTFQDTSTYEFGIDSVMWIFGNGNDTVAGDFIFNYVDTGFYLVSLTVFTSVGCNVNEPIDTLGMGMHTYPEFEWTHPDLENGEDTIKICYNEPLDWFYTGPDTSAYEGADTSRTDTIDPHSWTWTGQISSMDENPMTGFTEPDTGYFVTLITTHFGCVDTVFHMIDSIIGVGPEPEFVMNPTFFCLEPSPYEVFFINSSTFDAQNSTIEWNFGDGTSTTEVDPGIHIYEAPGEYFPSLTIQSVIQIEFAPEPDSFLTCTVTYPTFNYSVYIDNYELYSVNAPTFDFCDDGNAILSANVSSPISPPAYSQNTWDFGDGSEPITTFSNSELAIHQYDSAGVYELTVIGTNGICFDTFVQTVNVYERPQAEFLFPTDTVCAALTDSIQLFDASIPGDLNITGWKYEYFPGGPFEGIPLQNPKIKITKPENYFVKLQVTDEFGCVSDPITHEIEVNDLSIIVPDTNTCNNSVFSIDYSLISIDYPPITYLWEFGTGDTDTTDSPTVEFTGINKDSVFINTVTITDATGCPHTEEFEIGITLPQMEWGQSFDVFDCDIDGSFVARFFFSVTSTDSNIDTVIIDFGDGSPPAIIDTVEQAENWPHTYTTPGFFDVTFTVIDEFGCSNTVFLEDYVFVSGPVVNPSWSTEDLCPPLTVQFEAEDAFGIDEYLWFFGDGFTETTQNPVYEYTNSGDYAPVLWVSATIEDAEGNLHTCTIKYNDIDTISIDGPVIDFDFSDENQCAGSLAQINNLSENSDVFGAVKWEWNFGDGTPVEIQNTTIPTNPEPHNYQEGGTYVLTLTAFSEGDVCIYKKDSTLVVIPPLDLQPTTNYPPGCAPYTALFIPDQGDLINQIIDPFWDFGDGSTSDSLMPEHTYTVGGQDYNVTFTYLTEECEFQFIYEDPITIFPDPLAGFTFEPNVENNAVSSYDASNQSEDYESINWLLNGVFFSSDNQVNVPVKEGENILTLIAFTDKGCTDTIESILEPIEAINIITPNNDTQNDALFFQLSEDQMQCTSLNVYNRWGKLVYSDGSYTNDWKGVNNSGNDLSEGTYYYILEICGRGAIKGYVTIVR